MARRKISHFIIKYIFRIVCALFIAAVVGVLLWRMVSSGDPKELIPLTKNDILNEAYEKHGDSLYAFTQDDLDNITRTEYDYGYFSINRAVFIDGADQLQFILRYNNSTLKKISNKLGTELDSRNDDVFDAVVTVMYDLTPDNKNDNSGEDTSVVKKVQYTATSHITAQKNIYNYKKYIFDGIDITDDVIAVYVDIFYNKDIKAAGTLVIYDSVYPRNDYKLTKSDIDAIKG